MLRKMNKEQQHVLFENTARDMGDIPKEIKFDILMRIKG